MRIYIVRHGQSTSNALKNHEGGEVKLTPLGVRQSKKIATRVARLPCQIIIASDFTRALQTAAIIRKRLPKKLVITPLLREEKHPSEITGKHRDSSEVIQIKKFLHKNRNRRHWHFSDEENFFDLKSRMEKFVRFLKKRKEKNILIIGHVMATRMLIGVMTLGDALTADVFYKMRDHWILRNTGISVCDLVDGQWKLLTWNDHEDW